ncbi:hypothetical protein [Streptomyces alfalfae]
MADGTAPNGRPLEHTADIGHSRAAHRAHGFCSACPGIELWEELVAWRARENETHGSGLPDRAPHPSWQGERADD